MTSSNAPRVAVVTGASSGIGRAAAKTLAARGWRVIGTGRDPERARAAEAEIAEAAGAGGGFEMIRADLASMSDAARVAREIASRTDRVDLLLNNAGGVASAKAVTADGNEATFAGNHLGHFLLTGRLLPLLRRAAADAPPGSVRVVNTSSDASEMTKGFDWSDLQLLDAFDPGRAYCNAKLANVMFARGLARRLEGDGIVVHAQHPGVVASNFVNHADEKMRAYIRTLDARTSEDAGDALVWLATADEPGRSSGGYWHQREPHAPNPVATDEEAVERLWTESETLVARSGA